MTQQPSASSHLSSTRAFSRRRLLQLGLTATLGLTASGLLAACNPNAGPAQKPAAPSESKPTETKPAEAKPTAASQAAPAAQPAATTAPAAPAAAATSAPAAQAAPAAAGKKVQVEYWQYFFEAKQKLVNELIPEFQQANPGIEIVHNSEIPYEQYQQKLAAAAPTGQGPHVVNLFFGWLPKYVQSQYLQPLPESAFSSATLEKEFFPLVAKSQIQGKYWGIPTAVRTLALFWNKDIYKDAGLDPEKPPTTWDELVEHMLKTTKRSSDGKLEQAGFAWGPGGQGHAWWRECLTRQNGVAPISDDLKKLNWSDPRAVEAFTFFTDIVTKHKAGEPGFYTDDPTAFKTGHAAITIDGSFRLSTLKNDSPNLNYGVALLPKKQAQASFASFWANSLTKRATGDTLEASVKWLQFLTTPDVMKRWTDKTGELPAKTAAAADDKFAKDPKLGPFVKQLDTSYAGFTVDEGTTRQAVLDAVDQVILNKMDPGEAIKEGEQKIQAELDQYWASVKQ